MYFERVGTHGEFFAHIRIVNRDMHDEGVVGVRTRSLLGPVEDEKGRQRTGRSP